MPHSLLISLFATLFVALDGGLAQNITLTYQQNTSVFDQLGNASRHRYVRSQPYGLVHRTYNR